MAAADRAVVVSTGPPPQSSVLELADMLASEVASECDPQCADVGAQENSRNIPNQSNPLQRWAIRIEQSSADLPRTANRSAASSRCEVNRTAHEICKLCFGSRAFVMVSRSRSTELNSSNTTPVTLPEMASKSQRVSVGRSELIPVSRCDEVASNRRSRGPIPAAVTSQSE
jgi:hypothetical protein